jgi:hypothetical protein
LTNFAAVAMETKKGGFKKNLDSFPFFISMATAAKFVLPILICLAYLVPLDVDVTGNITGKLSEVWSEFNIFFTLVTMATAAILNFFQPNFAAVAMEIKKGGILKYF